MFAGAATVTVVASGLTPEVVVTAILAAIAGGATMWAKDLKREEWTPEERAAFLAATGRRRSNTRSNPLTGG